MKSFFTCIVIFILIISCKDTDQLTFEIANYQNSPCDDCPEVDIHIPKTIAISKIGNTIAQALREEVIFLLTFDEESTATTIQEAITSFSTGYSTLKNKYPEESTPWEAKIDATVSYEDNQIISIQLNSYIFTGGAHGYTVTRLLNFNKEKGLLLENWELFKHVEDFEDFTENNFRVKEKIPLNKPINSTGFMFEEDLFYLPENIGYTQKGLLLLYNQYEISSFAEGTITLILPYAEIKEHLAVKRKD